MISIHCLAGRAKSTIQYSFALHNINIVHHLLSKYFGQSQSIFVMIPLSFNACKCFLYQYHSCLYTLDSSGMLYFSTNNNLESTVPNSALVTISLGSNDAFGVFQSACNHINDNSHDNCI